MASFKSGSVSGEGELSSSGIAVGAVKPESVKSKTRMQQESSMSDISDFLTGRVVTHDGDRSSG